MARSADPSAADHRLPVDEAGDRGQVLRFSRHRKLAPKERQPFFQQRTTTHSGMTPRERFLHAIEIEKHGFVEGAVAFLKRLHREVEIDADPVLAINVRYFLASFLALCGDRKEALSLSEDGLLLAWEHNATEELELFEALSDQLGA